MSKKSLLFWKCFVGLFSVLLVSVMGVLLGLHVAYCSFSAPTNTSTIPLVKAFSGSPIGFAFLALVIAFSVYLRQVASGADEKRDKILKGDSHLFPLDGKLFIRKIDDLNETHETITAVAPFFVWLSIAAALRLFLDAFPPFGFRWVNRISSVITIVDFVLAEWLFLMFLMLGWFHLKASRRDEELRNLALAEQRHKPPFTSGAQ